MPVNPQFAAVVEYLKSAPSFTAVPLAQARAFFLSDPDQEKPAVARVEDFDVDLGSHRVGVRAYRPSAEPAGLIVYFHGGGWVLGSPDAADADIRALANDTNCAILSVDYRLAPEHPFPAGLEDCIGVFDWAAGNRVRLATERAKLILLGDSAGGNLAAGVALASRQRGGPVAALQVLIYPITDCAQDTASYQDPERGAVLKASDMAWFWDQYIADPAARDQPLRPPLRAETLAGLPPALVVLAGYDPLHDEGRAYADRLHAAEVAVTVMDHADLPHGFFSFGTMLPAAGAANREMARFVRAFLATNA